MTTGFHWHVAWRYLMARPRKVSAPVVVVAGIAFIVSAITGGSNTVMSRSIEMGFASDWAYRNVLVAAITLAGLGALGLLYAIVSYTRSFPNRVAIPFAAIGGLSLCAVGASAGVATDELTQTIALAVAIAGAALTGVTTFACWMQTRGQTSGALLLACLLFAAGLATAIMARVALAPMSTQAMTYPPALVLLPSLGLLVLGIAVALGGGILYFSPQRGRRRGLSSAGVSLMLLAGSALYPVAARRMLSAEELTQYAPIDTRIAMAAGLTALAAAGSIALLAIISFAARWRRRPRLAILAWFVILASCGALCLAIERYVLSPPSFLLISAISQGPNYPVLSVSWGGLALGELAVILAIVRYFFTFFTTVSVAGVAVGSWALVIVLSVMSGFESDLRKKILGSNAHILITKKSGAFTEYRDVAAKLTDVPGVQATTEYLVSEVVVAASSNYANVIIKGVNPATVGAVTELNDNIQKPDPPLAPEPDRRLDRLWPLAEDGTTLGPPDPSNGEGADGPAPSGHDNIGDLPDPPPPDMELDFGDPVDLSGEAAGEAAGDTDGDTDGQGQEQNHDPASALDREAESEDDDKPPADMDIDWSDPIDLSGEDEPESPKDEDNDNDLDEGIVIRPRDINHFERGGPLVDWDDILDKDYDPDLGGPLHDGLDQGFRRDDFDGDHDDDDIAAIEPRISPRVAQLPGVLVGQELEKQIHLYIGQEVRVVSPLSQDTPAGPIPRTRPLRVAGIFFTGMYEYDLKLIYVPLPTLQTFLDLGDEVTGIEIRITEPDDTAPVLAEICARLQVDCNAADDDKSQIYEVKDWKEINRNLFSALELEKIAMFLVLAIIILVASFSIIGNLIMIVVEKAKEIALLKTLGATSSEVMKVFVAQGFFIGLVGTLIGVTHGLLFCVLGSVYGIPLDPEVYYIDRLPIHVEPTSIAAVAVAGILISAIATLYPAVVGARMRPVEGLRYE